VIRVVLPAHLRTLARVNGEVVIEAGSGATPSTVLDAIEDRFPALRGAIRDHVTRKRRAYVRFFACERDISHDSPDTPLPDAVVTGDEPFFIIGAMSGG
jgi:molybdopterin converting factor small subunit